MKILISLIPNKASKITSSNSSDQARVHLAISRESVEACDIDPFIDAMTPFTDSPTLEMAGDFAITFSGYENTREEIYTIPAIRSYFRKLHSKWPYLFFFCTTFRENLQSLTFCLLDNISCKSTSDGSHSCVSFDTQELKSVVLDNFNHMNWMFQTSHMLDFDKIGFRCPMLQASLELAIFNRTRLIAESFFGKDHTNNAFSTIQNL